MATTNISKRSDKLRKTLEKTLSSSEANKLVSSAIKDLSSSKSLSLRTILLGAKFVLTNPINTYNLVKLAKSSNIYLDPEFQKSLLEEKPIWEFLKNNSDHLPKIGQILAKAGFREFQEGAFLDQKGLGILKESFKNEEVLNKLQEIAVEVKKEMPDWTKVTSTTLDMLAEDKNFKEFFNEKGKDIANYIKVGVTEILPSDYIKTFDDILQNPEKKNLYSEVTKIFNQNPSLKQELTENINNPNSLNKFNQLSPEKQAIMNNFIAETKEQAKPALKEYFESYRIDPEVLSTVPGLLNEIPKIKEIFDTLNNSNQGVMVALEKTLEMAKDNKELKDFLANNKEFLPNAALGIIENNPDLQKMTKEYNFDKQMLNIVGELMSKPKTAHSIISDVNKGDYISVTSDLISSLNDPSFKLKDILVQQSKEGLFNNLIQGVLEQDIQNNGTIKQQLADYGLETPDVTKLASVMPLLLDKPESLQKVFSGFIKSDYMGMAKELVKLTKDNPEIKQYLNDNKEIFASILDKTLADMPGINKLNKKELCEILPSILDHPNELIEVIEAVENKNYTTAASTTLYNLGIAGTATGIKYAAQAGLGYAAQTVTNIFSNAPQPVENKITDSDILIEQAVDKVFLQAQSEGKRDLPDKKQFRQQIKTLCHENLTLKDYIVEKLSSKPINSVGDVSTPVVNIYKHAKDHINSPVQVLNPLYESLVNNEDIKSNLVANIINEKVMHKLFGNGDNRGEDFYMTGKMLKQVISDYAKENPGSVDNFLKQENQKKLVNNIETMLKSKSKYTLAGLATGGIYLPKEIFTAELKDSLKNEFKNNIKSNVIVEAKNISSKLGRGIIDHNDSKSNSNISPPPVTPSLTGSTHKKENER